MTLLTSPETMAQLCFLESVKPIFDKFLESFQVEGPLIHNLYPCMVLLLKQMMSQFLKPEVIQKKTSRTVDIGYEAFRFSVEGQ